MRRIVATLLVLGWSWFASFAAGFAIGVSRGHTARERIIHDIDLCENYGLAPGELPDEARRQRCFEREKILCACAELPWNCAGGNSGAIEKRPANCGQYYSDWGAEGSKRCITEWTEAE